MEGREPSALCSDISDAGSREAPPIDKQNQQPLARSGAEGRGQYGRTPDPNRYRLHFESESKEEVERRKRAAKTTPISSLAEVRTHACHDHMLTSCTLMAA